MPRLPAHWLLWSALAIHLPIALVCAARSSQPIYDFERYYEIATTAGRPYLNFPVEYPPGTVLTLRTLATGAGGRGGFRLGLGRRRRCLLRAHRHSHRRPVFSARRSLVHGPGGRGRGGVAARTAQRLRPEPRRRRRAQTVAAGFFRSAARAGSIARAADTNRGRGRGRRGDPRRLDVDGRLVGLLPGADVSWRTRVGDRKHRRQRVDARQPEFHARRVGRLAHRDDERSEEHTSELQSRQYLVCRLLLEKKKIKHRYGNVSIPQRRCLRRAGTRLGE